MSVRPFGVIHISFLMCLAIGGWVGLLALTLAPLPIFQPVALTVDLVVVGLMVGVARLLSFRIYRRARIALDTTFYVAARFAFGTVAACWILAIALTLSMILTSVRGTGWVPRGEAPWRHNLALMGYAGGAPVLMMITTGWLFRDHPLHAFDDTALFVTVPAFALVFLFMHYSVVGSAARFLGIEPRSLWRGFLPRVLAAELTLVPLSLAMVLSYKLQGLPMFVVVGATGLLFGGIFRRWQVAQEDLRRHVEELETINKVGRVIASSHDQPSLFKGLAIASQELVGGDSLFMVGIADESDDRVAYWIFAEDGEAVKQLVAPREAGVSGWVMAHREALILGDLRREYRLYVDDDRYDDERYQSWIAVPLVAYGGVIGIISMQTIRRDAYTKAHLRVLATIADQAAIAIENSRLYELATVDGLTGLFVRRYFDYRLAEELARATRYGGDFTLGLFDLDHFKQLNDTYGHQVGDDVLRAAAVVVRRNMRSFDLAARYGGEEFAFILPRTQLSDALGVADRIRREVSEIEVPTKTGTARVTVSIGLAAAPAPGVSDVDTLLSRADEALYRAKREGRDRVESHQSE